MSHRWWRIQMSHVTHEWDISHMNKSCHTWMSHVTHEQVMSHMNASCNTCMSHHVAHVMTHSTLMSHKWRFVPISHVTHEWVMSHRWWRIPMSHVAQVACSSDSVKRDKLWNESCHTGLEWVMSQRNKSCHTGHDSFQRVVSHTGMRHVTQVKTHSKGSCHTQKCVMSHRWRLIRKGRVAHKYASCHTGEDSFQRVVSHTGDVRGSISETWQAVGAFSLHFLRSGGMYQWVMSHILYIYKPLSFSLSHTHVLSLSLTFTLACAQRVCINDSCHTYYILSFFIFLSLTNTHFVHTCYDFCCTPCHSVVCMNESFHAYSICTNFSYTHTCTNIHTHALSFSLSFFFSHAHTHFLHIHHIFRCTLGP